MTEWTPEAIEAAQDRYLQDLESILKGSMAKSDKHVILLSGGMDSFLIVAVLYAVMPKTKLRTLTIRGMDTKDANGADEIAAFFGTQHHVHRVTIDDIVANIDMIKGKGYETLRPAMSHICFQLALASYNVKQCVVFSGQGADVLYGNRKSIYASICETDGNSTEAEGKRTELKQKFYETTDFSSHPTIDVVNGLGGEIFMPYADPRLAYLSRIPFSVIRPFEKRFVKDAVARRYGLGAIAERDRISMQEGTGLYYPLKDRLKQEYGGISDSAIEIIRTISQK